MAKGIRGHLSKQDDGRVPVGSPVRQGQSTAALVLSAGPARVRDILPPFQEGGGCIGNGKAASGTGPCLSDRMDESLELFYDTFPTYLAEVMPNPIPREKQQTLERREISFSSEAQAVLDQLCQSDQSLYEHANKVLTDRLANCRQKKSEDKQSS